MSQRGFDPPDLLSFDCWTRVRPDVDHILFSLEELIKQFGAENVRETIAAEVKRLRDEHLPLTDEQKTRLGRILDAAQIPE